MPLEYCRRSLFGYLVSAFFRTQMVHMDHGSAVGSEPWVSLQQHVNGPGRQVTRYWYFENKSKIKIIDRLKDVSDKHTYIHTSL